MKLWLIRHGETQWSLSGAHTSRTDIPLTERGRQRAEKIHDYLAQRKFSLVLTSPLQRARATCPSGTTASSKAAPPPTFGKTSPTGLSGTLLYRKANPWSMSPPGLRR